ncbi:MAG: toprim domain-containing protein [Rhodospirillaceae bacterium]|nr:toprim domain-containing protein [Rhodospirillaceae bacterium]
MRYGPSSAAAIAAALAARAEEVCRRYLPHGRRQGRYWVAGDLDGARGRSLFVRLSGAGKPGKWTDAATGEHGDLLDLIRHRTNAPTLRAALDEARAFLALPASPATAPDAPYDATEAARRLWRRCRAVDGSHAERYLRARGLSRCRFAALRFHPALRYREGATVRRFPALVAAVTAGPGEENGRAIAGVQRTWLDPRLPAKAGVAAPRKALGRVYGLAVRFGAPSDDAALVVGEGIETVLSLITAVPEITAAAALSAGSLGAFAPPPGVERLVIARDNDEDGALAAERLARRCARLGVAATVIVPAGNDFNDDLVALGSAALRARFAPLFRPAACAPGPGAARPDPLSGGGREERRVGQADRERGGRTWTPSST